MASTEDQIKMTNKTEFIASVVLLINSNDADYVGSLLWTFANEQWRDGYRQGKYDPNFDKCVG